MTLAEDTLRIWMSDARRSLHRYGDHPHFDDIVAEAYLAMWEAIDGADADKVRDLHAYAMRAAWNGAQTFLSSPRNEQRTWSVFKRKAFAPTLYWQDIGDARSAEWLPSGLIEPDFAPRLVERLAAEQELATMKPARRAALWLCCVEGLTREEARLRLGFSRTKIDKLLARVPFAAIPYAHPGPGAPLNWRARSRDQRGCFR